MKAAESESSRNIARGNSELNVSLWACLTAVVCYLAAKLGGFLIIRDPQTLWLRWAGRGAALPILLLVLPRRGCAPEMPAGRTGLAPSELRGGVPGRAIAWLI